jgi:hypothetical protein
MDTISQMAATSTNSMITTNIKITKTTIIMATIKILNTILRITARDNSNRDITTTINNPTLIMLNKISSITTSMPVVLKEVTISCITRKDKTTTKVATNITKE